MMIKKNKVINIPTFNCDDRKKFSAFVALLVQIDKHMNADIHAETSRTRSKKAKKKDIGKLYKEGSQSGPSLYLLKLLKHFIFPCKLELKLPFFKDLLWLEKSIWLKSKSNFQFTLFARF